MTAAAAATTMLGTAAFEVKRDDLRDTRLVGGGIDLAAETAAGRAVVAVDRFALTANNITYAAFGEQMAYWSFFPASDGYGRIPVWGFADVVASGAEGLAEGERLFGYWPMATHCVVEPTRISSRRFVDASAHRRDLPPVYNSYERVAADPAYARDREALQMLLRPLFALSFLAADFLDDNGFFGGTQVLVSSASSKTSLGFGHALRRLARPGIRTVGLTSPGNRAFVEASGAYDGVATYDAIEGFDASVPTVYVDMAGGAALLTRIHTHFGDRLVYSCRIGGTQWEDLAGRMDLPGARPRFFFAPDQMVKRHSDWGPGGFDQRFGEAWQSVLKPAASWLTIVEEHGPDAVEQRYHDTLEGRVPPSEGLVLSLAD